MSSQYMDNTNQGLRNRPNLSQPLSQTTPTPSNPLETKPLVNSPHGNIPNTPLSSATISFLLGITFCFGVHSFANDLLDLSSFLPSQLGFFVSAWAFFHWAEFAVTAGWNLEKCSIDSYLLDNGAMYHLSNGIAIFEYVIVRYFWPNMKSYSYISQIGVALVLLGQLLRSMAMIHASTNFSHLVAFNKRASHQLVTDGVYGWFRHPSYAGFFYWALGTQLVLQNPISFAMFAIVLWRFFYYRTRSEEGALIKFFGQDYTDYRKRVGTKIPFIP